MRQVLLVLLLVALTACTASRQQARSQADQHYQIAQSYLGNGSYLLAEQEIKKALDIVPEDPRYLEVLALIYQFQNRLQLAEDAYRLASQQPDVPPSVLVNYGNLLLMRERPDDTIALVRQALQQNYNKPASAYTNLGLAYLKKNDFRQAVVQFRTALEYQPDLPEAHYNLGLAYVGLNDSGKAIHAFRQATRFRPNYVDAYSSLSEVLLASGRSEEAHLVLERVVTLGKELLKSGRTEAARLAFERVVALAPNSDMAVTSRKQLKLLTP